MKCAKCGRALSKVRFMLNGRILGPECYEKEAGPRIAPKRKRLVKKRAQNPKFKAPEIERDDRTLDLFGD